MKRTTLALLSIAAATTLLFAAAKQARVTQVVHDVKLLAKKAAPRPAALNDSVTDDTGVRTGGESRAELTFPDLTITRVGANSIFSFDQGGRNIDVENGAILLRVPKDSGGARIHSAAVTVGITGTTVLFEYNRYSKLIVLEGSCRLWLNGNRAEAVTVHGGQMLIVKPGAKQLPSPVNIDLAGVVHTALLITKFPPLPSLDLIQAVIDSQKNSAQPLLNANRDLTGMSARDVNASTRPSATPRRRPQNRLKP